MTTENARSVVRNDMYGRLDIYSTLDDINEDGLVGELNSALVYHVQNMLQEDYLYWYTRGVQPILNRHKDIREDIMNIVQVNTAAEVVDFKNGYLLQKPCAYTARVKNKQGKLKKLNEYLYRSGKADADNKVADWFHRVGKGVLYVEPSDDNEAPFKAYALDPRSAFVVYSLRPGNKPVMGVNFVTQDEVAKFDVFTESTVYHLSGAIKGKMMTTEKNHNYLVTATAIESSEPNVLGYIPIIEYRYNSVNTSAFELAIPLLDELSNLASNACDGIDLTPSGSPAVCGVRITFFISRSGLSDASGSSVYTSRHAPAISPFFNDLIRAFSSITAPRDVLISKAVRFMFSNSALPILPRVSADRGR